MFAAENNNKQDELQINKQLNESKANERPNTTELNKRMVQSEDRHSQLKQQKQQRRKPWEQRQLKMRSHIQPRNLARTYIRSVCITVRDILYRIWATALKFEKEMLTENWPSYFKFSSIRRMLSFYVALLCLSVSKLSQN